MPRPHRKHDPSEITKAGANKGKKKQIIFEDSFHGDIVDVDSVEEWYTFAWIEELREMGIVKDFVYQPPSFSLTPKYTYRPMGAEQKERHLLLQHTYTADFKVTAYADTPENREYLSLAFKIDQKDVRKDEETGRDVADVWIDVKGSWNHKGELFSVNQKLVYMVHGIYINKFVPKKAFLKAGAPRLAAQTPTGRPCRVYAGYPMIAKVYSKKPAEQLGGQNG